MTEYRANARVSAALFFICWLAVLYAGADHPPPRGFLGVVLVLLVCSLVVHFRVPTYVSWIRSQKPDRHLHVLLAGLVAGAVVAALMALLPGTGEPSVTPSIAGTVIWWTIVMGVGVANSVTIYAANAIMAKIRP